MFSKSNDWFFVLFISYKEMKMKFIGSKKKTRKDRFISFENDHGKNEGLCVKILFVHILIDF